jgi:hypothetical protein
MPPMKPFLLVCLTALILVTSNAFAQGKIDLKAGDSLQSVLAREVGSAVELRMKSGEKIAGKVEKVTDKLVHIAQLRDADFYDAAVEIDDVAAVVVRARSN